MATTLKLRRGSQAEADAFTGEQGELFVNTTTNTVAVHDGVNAGGNEMVDQQYIDNLDFLEIKDQNVPSSATDTGVKGTVVIGTAYVYLCKDTDAWVRFAIQSSW